MPLEKLAAVNTVTVTSSEEVIISLSLKAGEVDANLLVLFTLDDPCHVHVVRIVAWIGRRSYLNDGAFIHDLDNTFSCQI